MAEERPKKVAFRKAKVVDDPIPEADIIRGRPRARTCVLHEDEGGAYVSGVWHCSPRTNHWTYARHEYVNFDEGQARLRRDDGRTITVRKGEAAQFPKGHCVWTVSRTVKKVFVLRG